MFRTTPIFGCHVTTVENVWKLGLRGLFSKYENSGDSIYNVNTNNNLNYAIYFSYLPLAVSPPGAPEITTYK